MECLNLSRKKNVAGIDHDWRFISIHHHLCKKVTTCAQMFLFRVFLGLETALSFRLLTKVHLAFHINTFCVHPCTTKETNKFVPFQFLIQALNFLTHILDYPTCFFLNFSLDCILLSCQVSNQFPKDLILESIYLSTSKCFFD